MLFLLLKVFEHCLQGMNFLHFLPHGGNELFPFHQKIVLGSVETWAEPEPVFKKLKVILRESGTKFISARALKARVLAVASSKAVPKLKIPMSRIVIIDSADDPLIPASTRKAMRKTYKGAKAYNFKIGGHYPYVTRPKQYTDVLKRYVLG